MSVFHKNQLVWAKIKGYPWWPASVFTDEFLCYNPPRSLNQTKEKME